MVVTCSSGDVAVVVVTCSSGDSLSPTQHWGRGLYLYLSVCLSSPGKWTCEDDGLTFRTTARDLQKRVKLDCKNGRLIAGLTFVGHNGTCQGLTPDLFVQVGRSSPQPLLVALAVEVVTSL